MSEETELLAKIDRVATKREIARLTAHLTHLAYRLENRGTRIRPEQMAGTLRELLDTCTALMYHHSIRAHLVEAEVQQIFAALQEPAQEPKAEAPDA